MATSMLRDLKTAFEQDLSKIPSRITTLVVKVQNAYLPEIMDQMVKIWEHQDWKTKDKSKSHRKKPIGHLQGIKDLLIVNTPIPKDTCSDNF